MSAPEADPAAGVETEAPPRNDLPRGADRWKPSALHGLDPLRNPSDRREPFAQRKVSQFFSDPTIRKIVGGNVLYLRAVADYADDTDDDSSSSSYEDLCNEIVPATAYVPVPGPHPQHPDAPVAKRVSFSAAADVQADAPRQRRRSSSPSSTTPSPPPSPTRRDVEEFLFSMLGDGFNLSMEVIRGVLGNCGYDIKKSMEELMSFSAKDLGKNPVKIIPCSKEPVVRDEDEHQHCYRMDAKQHWDMMKQYFERAANAFKDRDQTYVKYLLEQGKNCYGMARLSEEKSSGEIKSNF